MFDITSAFSANVAERPSLAMESSAKSTQSTGGESKAGDKTGKTNGVTIDPAIKELCSTDEIEALYKKLSIDEVSLSHQTIFVWFSCMCCFSAVRASL